MAATGRPSDYTPALAAVICAEIASGKSLRAVCRADDMPSAATVFAWIGKYPEFLEQYVASTAARSDAHAEDVLEIADDDAADGENSQSVARARLRVDSRKWLMARMQPKKYGDRVAQEITGKDGSPLIPEVSETELARRAAFVIADLLRKTDPEPKDQP